MTTEQMVLTAEGFELRVANAIAHRFNGFIGPKPRGRDKEKDVTIFVPMDIEIKRDMMSQETGNAFFECYNSLLVEKSGLRATKAIWWAHYLPSFNQIAIFEPKKMLTALEGSAYRYCELVGDDNSDGYIVPIRELRDFPFVRWIEFYEE